MFVFPFHSEWRLWVLGSTLKSKERMCEHHVPASSALGVSVRESSSPSTQWLASDNYEKRGPLDLLVRWTRVCLMLLPSHILQHRASSGFSALWHMSR